MHPSDIDGWAGTDQVTPEQRQRTVELLAEIRDCAPDPFEGLRPEPRFPSTYHVFRDREGAPVFRTIRFVIGAALAAFLALFAIAAVEALAVWTLIGVGVVKDIRAWKCRPPLPSPGTRRIGDHIDV